LHEEELDRILDPHDFLARHGRAAIFDLRAIEVRDYALALNAAAQPHVLQFG